MRSKIQKRKKTLATRSNGTLAERLPVCAYVGKTEKNRKIGKLFSVCPLKKTIAYDIMDKNMCIFTLPARKKRVRVAKSAKEGG